MKLNMSVILEVSPRAIPEPYVVPYRWFKSSGSVGRSSRGVYYPEEDWTKISELAERRRIQNHIAQRSYRR